MKKSYEIIMRTQLGKRNGLLNLNILEDQIEGSFCFLKHKLPLSGRTFPDGHIELFGTFITLQKTHSYHAYGMIGDTGIHLQLYEGNRCYQAEGTEVKEDHE